MMSKLLERLVAKQLVGYLTASGLLPRLQSAYRAHHSTETAVLKVMTDILRAFDTGNLAVLTLLACVRYRRSCHFFASVERDLWP